MNVGREQERVKVDSPSRVTRSALLSAGTTRDSPAARSFEPGPRVDTLVQPLQRNIRGADAVLFDILGLSRYLNTKKSQPVTLN